MMAYLDIAPLLENNWTGIPVVTAALAQSFLNQHEFDARFLYNTQEVPRAIVEELLFCRSGRSVKERMPTTLFRWRYPSYREMGASVAIFPNVKTYRSTFSAEAMVIHDLSTVLTPEYHHADTVNHHANRLLGDITTTDHFFCVSSATADDLSAYFKVKEERITRSRLGVEWPLSTVIEANSLIRGLEFEPFILVLGTLEPRKNASVVLDFLKENPSIIDTHTFVFAGRSGWLSEREKLEALLGSDLLHSGRILFPGYIPDAAKLALLRTCSFCIFPSMFEGFGLPVLEAISVGCPVLASNSSSITEAGLGGQCIFFRPDSFESFATAFRLAYDTFPQRAHRQQGWSADVQEELSWKHFTSAVNAWVVNHS